MSEAVRSQENVRARSGPAFHFPTAAMAMRINLARRMMTKNVGDATDELVHEHPWHAIGVAALAGVVVGIMIGRR